LYRELNLRNEESSLSVAVSSGSATIPTDFKGLKIGLVVESPTIRLQWTTLEWMYDNYPVRSGSNTPCFITRERNSFIFGPYPKDFTLGGTYYAKQDNLHTSDNSWYVLNAPELLLYGSLFEAHKFIKDFDNANHWLGMFNDAKRSVIEEERNTASTRGQKQARPG